MNNRSQRASCLPFRVISGLVMVVALGTTACSGSSNTASSDNTAPSNDAATETAPVDTGQTASPCDPIDPSTCTLRQLADARGVLIGTAVAAGPVTDEPQYGETLSREFNSITPENAFKWPQTEPEAGAYTWEEADLIADFATEHDMALRGHTLVWPNSSSAAQFSIVPDYVYEAPDAASMQRYIDDHIEAVVTRYADVTDRWDVVNEPLVTIGSEVDANPLTDTLGEAWMVRAFEQAHELDPTAELYLNEVLTERPGPKHDALVALVTRLLDAGAPIDGIGLQSHFIGGPPTTDELAAVMSDWEALGLDVAITELDIPTVDGDGATQAQQYADVVATCLTSDACHEVTVWGLTDGFTWLDSLVGEGSAPLLFDEDYQPKPAYVAVAETLAAG